MVCPTYCLLHILHWIRYTTLLLWQVRGDPFVTIGKHLPLTLLLTKLLVWLILLHMLQILRQHGLTTFFFGKSLKGKLFNSLNVGGFLPV